MSIRHAHKPVRERFTQIPNAWARDQRLSLKARGLLLLLMGHTAGYRVSVKSLIAAGPDGEAAVRSGIEELEAAGYLVREQQRTAGRFRDVDWFIVDPEQEPYPADEPDDETEDFELDIPATGTRFPRAGSPRAGESGPYREDQALEDHPEEHQGVSTRERARPFEEFWQAWPGRRVARQDAQKAHARAVKAAGAQAVIDGVRRLAADPNLPEQQFIPHPATWLNRHGWEDDPYPARTAPQGGPTPLKESTRDRLARIDARMAEQRAAYMHGDRDRREITR